MRLVLLLFAGSVITMTLRVHEVLKVFILLLCSSVWATEGSVRSDISVFLEALSYVESNHRDDAVGDNAASIGRYQIKQALWLDISSNRAHLQLDIYPYHDAKDATKARIYATHFFGWLDDWFLATYSRLPKDGERLLVWQLGLRGATKIGFDTSRAKPHNIRAYQKLQQHISHHGKPKHNSGASGDRIKSQTTGERQEVCCPR